MSALSRGASGPLAVLVCLPHAGGRAAAFRRWIPALADVARVHPLDRPGRHTRVAEPVETDADAIVEDVVRRCAALRDEQLVLFGHSLGGRLAYEAAARMERRGLRVGGVVVSGVRSPEHAEAPVGAEGLDEGLDDGGLDDGALLDRLRRWGGVPEDLLRSPEFLRQALPPLRADLLVGRAHRDRGDVLAAPVLALAGAGDTTAPPSTVAGWSARTRDWRGLTVVPGGHFFHLTHEALVLRVVRSAVLSGGLAAHTADSEVLAR